MEWTPADDPDTISTSAVSNTLEGTGQLVRAGADLAQNAPIIYYMYGQKAGHIMHIIDSEDSIVRSSTA